MLSRSHRASSTSCSRPDVRKQTSLPPGRRCVRPQIRRAIHARARIAAMPELQRPRQTDLESRSRLNSSRCRHSPRPLAGFWLRRARFQHAAAAVFRAAVAGKDDIDIRWVVGVALDSIVVREFLTRLDAANRLDEYALSDIDGLAIWGAAVIHEARFIAVDAGIDHGLRVHGEQECVAILGVLVLVAGIGALVAHALAEIFDDIRAFAHSPQRKYAVAMNARAAALKQMAIGAQRW